MLEMMKERNRERGRNEKYRERKDQVVKWCVYLVHHLLLLFLSSPNFALDALMKHVAGPAMQQRINEQQNHGL